MLLFSIHNFLKYLSDHTCGIEDNKLFCWGSDSHGQQGNGEAKKSLVGIPEQIGLSQSWASITAGDRFTCGIDADKTYCWGSDFFGQLGNGTGTGADAREPYQVGLSSDWQGVDSGSAHTCGIEGDHLYCWGYNYDGQTGLNTGTASPIVTPTKVKLLGDWTTLALGSNHTCGINTGQLYCWGLQASGRLGNNSGSIANVNEPLLIGSSNSWQTVVAGPSHSCGINNGQLFCWGRDTNGKLGNGVGSGNLEVPTQIGSSNLWQKISVGGEHTCGIDNGFLFCWGENDNGQIGHGSIGGADVLVPTQIGVSNSWESVSTGYSHTCGIDGGKLFCWGDAYSGQIGIGIFGFDMDAPVQIGVSSEWQTISSGSVHTCGITGGMLYCWGSNEFGQLGIGIINNSNAPIQVGVETDWQSVSTGSSHTCGLKNDKLFCWGSDTEGQIGRSSGFVGSPFLIIE